MGATLLVHFRHSNRAELLRHVGQASDATVIRLAQLKALVMAHGTSEYLAPTKALWLLDGIIRKEAAMLAFERLFLGLGLTLLAALPLLLLMQRGHFFRQTDGLDH